jgi:hypothetical protein
MRKFIIKISFYFVPFICFLAFYRFYILTNISGDMGILAKLPFKAQYGKMLEENTLQDYIVFDTLINQSSTLIFKNKPTIITIGDSFSQLDKKGYQNYFAHLFNFEVVNIKRNDMNTPVQDAISFLNSGIIDSTTCHIVVIESVDRAVFERLTNPDFSQTFTYFTPTEIKKKKHPYEFDLFQLTSFIRLMFGYENPISQYDLDDNYFTHSWGNTAYCYVYELLSFANISQNDIKLAKENLIKLNEMFDKKGIKMIFLIAADKYDVYRPFMQDKTLPIDTSTDDFDRIPNVCVINTKSILQDMIHNGEKDVYEINDSHWSYKASEAVAKKLAHDIDSLGILKKEGSR